MHIFSSLLASDIQVSESSSRGVQALKDFLLYAEQGQIVEKNLAQPEKQGDFAAALRIMLEKKGYECR